MNTISNNSEYFFQPTPHTPNFTIPGYEARIMSVAGSIFRKFGILSGYEYRLMLSISRDLPNEIRKFCNLGADYNTTLFHLYDYTPLMYAIECRSNEALRELIRVGADVNKRSNSRDKVTALYLSVRSRYFGDKQDQITSMHILLQNGANPNLAVKGGATALMEAAFQGNEEALQKLIEYDVDLNLIGYKKNTALDLAIESLGFENQTVQKLISLGAKCFSDLESQYAIIPISQFLLDEYPFGLQTDLPQIVDVEDVFHSGYLLPNQALKAVIEYEGNENKIKKYDERFPSLFRSILRGHSDYILYDSHAFFTTCEGCLNGISANNYLGKGGQAKVKIAQSIDSGEFLAARITKEVGRYEIEILEMMELLIDYIQEGNKHYIIQRLLKGCCLSDYLDSFLNWNRHPEIHYSNITDIMIQLLTQLDNLHKNGYLHRDFAPDNIMIDPETGNVTIIDYGCAVKEPKYKNGYIYDYVSKASLGFAPELKKQTIYGFPYSQQTDIYALGSIFFKLLRLLNPYESQEDYPSYLENGMQIYRQMTEILPENRLDATYYLDIFLAMKQTKKTVNLSTKNNVLKNE